MRSLKNGQIKIQESIKELPTWRFREFQKYLVQNSGIGSDITDIARHYENLDLFIASNRLEDAATERTNMHFNFFFMLNGINIQHLAFGVLIEEFGGAKITDHSETNLIVISDRIGKESDLTQKELEEVLTEVKKKLIPN